jgi:hypothetical protein
MGFRPKVRVSLWLFEIFVVSGNRPQSLVRSVLVAAAGGTLG